jgi:hypothetical protein
MKHKGKVHIALSIFSKKKKLVNIVLIQNGNTESNRRARIIPCVKGTNRRLKFKIIPVGDKEVILYKTPTSFEIVGEFSIPKEKAKPFFTQHSTDFGARGGGLGTIVVKGDCDYHNYPKTLQRKLSFVS